MLFRSHQVAGVSRVENFLKVEFPPSITLPSDKEINRSIENMLLWNNKITSTGIRVETHDGVVVLSGVAQSYWEKYLAGDIAMSANGVIEVENNLSVKPQKSIIDMDIENDIRKTYQRSALIDEEKIQVEVKDGFVHLTGSVSNYLIKKQAHDIAMYTAGVMDVIDEITIA